MAAILELLGRQRKQRVGTADDVLAAAARDHAAGKAPDLEAVDRALHELGMPIEHFAELCRIAALRRDARATLDKLGTAQKAQRRLEDALAAERRQFDEYRDAYLARTAKLEAEKAGSDAVVAKAQQARETLLVPSNVLGSLRQRYEDALAEQQSGHETVERLRREIRDQRNRDREADRWIESIMQLHATDIQPAGLLRKSSTLPLAVANKLEPHELTKARVQRRLDEIEPQLREAEEALDRATKAVVAIELETLKS